MSRIGWRGWWDESEKKDSPGAWEMFYLLSFGEVAGDYRETTDNDLRLAGYAPVRECDALRKRNDKLEAVLGSLRAGQQAIIEGDSHWVLRTSAKRVIAIIDAALDKEDA